MNIIITLAGQSKRFKKEGYKEPKFLIEIDGITMIEHVIEMFDPKDQFFFIINKKQNENYPFFKKIIKKIINNFKIIVIEEHDLGPAHSIFQLKNIIPNDEPIIISYCDFYVEWNYKNFLKEIRDYEGAIPCFKGFQPSSFGNTKYAYVKTNKNLELLQLREKESFTNDRHEEYASAGIYYLKSFNLFLETSKTLFREGSGNLDEFYVSLLYNIIIRNKGLVKITSVDKFICWGTPEDLSMYNFWSKYFLKSAKKNKNPITLPTKKNLINLIPMAGKGSRFKVEKFNVLKPLININSEAMFIKASLTFPEPDNWIFLINSDVLIKNNFIHNLLEKKLNDSLIIPVKKHTSGQAATCLLAKSKIKDSKKELFISSCDYLVYYDVNLWENMKKETDTDVIVWTYKLNSMLVKDFNAFAYCQIDENGTVTSIVEKSTISNNPKNDNMIIGSFWFKNANDFIYSAENAVRNNINVNGEHYIGNSLNALIKNGKKIKVFEVDQWISLGDPFELNIYFFWEDFFHNRYKKIT